MGKGRPGGQGIAATEGGEDRPMPESDNGEPRSWDFTGNYGHLQDSHVNVDRRKHWDMFRYPEVCH